LFIIMLVSLNLWAQGSTTVYLSEDFQAAATLPSGWDNADADPTSAPTANRWKITTIRIGNARTATLAAKNTAVNKARLKTPVISLNATEPAMLSLKLTSPANGNFNIYVSTDSGTTYTQNVLATGLTATGTLKTYDFSLAQFAGQNIRIVFEGCSSTATATLTYAIDDVVVKKAKTCQDAVSPVVTSLGATSATVSWSLDTKYGVAPDLYTVSLFEGSTLVSYNGAYATTTNSIAFSSLNAGTTYTAWIRSNCETTQSKGYSDSVSVTFSTVAAAINPPYNENFNSLTALPTNSYGRNASINSNSQYAYGYIGKSLKLTTTANENAYIIFPLLNMMGNDIEMDLRIRRESIVSSTVGTIQYKAGYMTDPMDVGTFAVFLEDSLNAGVEWKSIRFNTATDVAPANGVMPVIMVDAGYAASVYIDDISVHNIPNCFRPENFALTSYTTNSATVSWAATSNVRVMAVNGTDTISAIATQSPYTLTGLTESTEYSLYLRGICAADSSDLTDPIVITTFCSTAASPIVNETFESVTANKAPACWLMGWTTKPIDNESVSPFTVSTTEKHNGSKSFTLAKQVNGTISFLSTQALPIDSANKYEVSIWVYRQELNSNTSEGIEIWATPQPNTTAGGTLLGTIKREWDEAPAENAAGWYQYEFVIPAQGTQHIMIVGNSTNGAPVYFDDFEVRLAPTCKRVSHITPGSVGTSSFDITWTPGADEQQWIVNYTSTNSDGVVCSNSIVTSTASCTMTGLPAATNQTIVASIRAICTPGDTSEAVYYSKTIQTNCLPLTTLPYSTGFETTDMVNDATSPLPICWTKETGNAIAGLEYPRIEFASGQAYTGTGYLYYKQFNYAAVNPPRANEYPDPEIAVMPGIDTTVYPMNTLKVTFFARNQTSTAACETPPLEVGIVVDPHNTATFTPIDTLWLTNTWAEYTVAFTDYDGQGTYPAFVLRNSTTNHRYMYIDDVTIDVIPPCQDIVDTLWLDSLTQTSVRVTIADSAVGNWSIGYGVKGTNPDQYTTIDVNGAMSYTITGLTPGTSYDLCIRSKCEFGGYGSWSSKRCFGTNSTPAAIPYVCGFEDPTENTKWLISEGTGANNLVIGTASSAVRSGLHGMYVSNDGGTTFAYTNSLSSSTCATRTFHFDSKGYQVDFDWRLTGGENADADFAMVMLVPADKPMTGAKGSLYSEMELPSGTIVLCPDKECHFYTTGTRIVTDANGWATYSHYLNMIGRAGDYNMVVYWNNNESAGTQTPFAIDNISVEELSCIPADTIAIAAGIDTARFDIVQMNTTGHQFIIDDEPFTLTQMPTVPAYNVTDTTGSFVIRNLTSNTTYYYTQRTLCANGDTSQWGDMTTFLTECADIQGGYTENFESPLSINCWEEVNMDTIATSGVSFNTAYHHAGLQSLQIASTAVSMPHCNVDSLEKYQLSGWVYTADDDASIVVGVATNRDSILETYDAISAVPVGTAGAWHPFTVYFNPLGTPDYSDLRMAKEIVISSGPATILIDDIRFELAATCPQPYAGTINNVTDNSFNITFTDNASASQWAVYINNVPRIVNATSTTITGLEPMTTYTVGVAAICGAGDTSAITPFDNVITDCGVAKLPWRCSFEQEEGYHYTSYQSGALEERCWNTLNDRYGAATPSYNTSATATYVYSGSQGLYINTTTGAVKDSIFLILPETQDSTNNIRASFMYKTKAATATQSLLHFGFMTDINDENSFTPLQTLAMSTTWTPFTITTNLPNVPGNARLAICMSKHTTTSWTAVDDIILLPLKGCAEINTPIVSNVRSTSIEVSVNDTLDRTYQYVVGNYKFVPEKATNIVTVDSNIFTVTNLEPDTKYDIYVRAICSAGDTSNWIGTTFHTECAPYAISLTNPFVDNFDNLASSTALAGCYATSGTNTSYYFQAIANSSTILYGHSSSGVAISCKLEDGNTTGITAYRSMHLEAGKMYNASIYYFSPATRNLIGVQSVVKLMYGTEPEMIAMNVIDTAKVESKVVTKVNNVSDYSTMYDELTGNFSVAETGDYYVAFNVYSTLPAQAGPRPILTLNQPTYVDDFTVTELPPCYPPTVNLENTTLTTATFSISDTVASHVYEYELFHENVSVSGIRTVVGNPFTIDSLMTSAAYTIKVRQSCGNNLYSEWTPVTFNTQCGAVGDFPVTYTFDDGAMPACWTLYKPTSNTNGRNWAISNEKSHSGNYSLNFKKTFSGRSTATTSALNLTSPYGYYVSFWLYRSLTSRDVVDMVHVLYGDTAITAESQIGEAHEIGSVNINYLKTPVVAAEGWYQYTFEIPAGVTGTRYVSFLSETNYELDIYVDDIVIEPIPSCVAPKSTPTIVLNTTTTVTADVSMGTKTEAEVAIALSATPDVIIASANTTNGSASFANLDSATTYALRYRYICVAGDTSAWSPAAIVSTRNDDCFDPMSVRTVGLLNDHHASLTWGKAPNATSCEYRLQTGGVTVDSAATTADTLAFDSLMANTAYTFSVRTYCAGVPSVWQSVTFNTTLRTFTLPFVCNFEDAAENSNWIMRNPATGANMLMIGNDQTAVKNGQRALYVSDNGNTFRYTAGVTGTTAEVLLELETGNIIVDYDWMCNGEAATDFGRMFLIPASTTITDAGYQIFNNSLPDGYISADGNARLNMQPTWQHKSEVVNIANAGVYKLVALFATNATGVSAPGLAIDNIMVEKVECMPVNSVNVATLAATSVSAVVVKADSTAIEYGISEYAAADSVETWLTSDNGLMTDTIAIAGLMPEATYTIFVRSRCDATHASRTRYATFTTPTNAVSAPYVCSFETSESDIKKWQLTSGTAVNAFVIGTANHNSGQRALYVSNNGVQHAYSANDASWSYAYIPMNLEAGAYDISFDWICEGESNFDYGRAFIAPSTMIPTDNQMMTGLSHTSVPAGCTAIDGGQMRGNGLWTTRNDVIRFSNDADVNLVFAWRNNNQTANQPPLGIDNISVTRISCPSIEVSGISADTIGSDMFRLKVMSNNAGASMVYSVYTDAEHTMMVGQGTVAAGDTLMTVSNLASATNYYIQLYSVCAVGDTSTAADYTVRTICGINTIYPYAEGFETYRTGSTNRTELDDNCWSTEASNTAAYYSIATSSQNAGAKALHIYNSNITGTTQTFVMPEMDALTGKTMSLYCMNASTAPGTIELGYADATMTFVALTSMTERAEYTKVSHTFGTIPTDARAAFRITGTGNHYVDDLRINTIVDGGEYYDTICFNSAYSQHGFSAAAASLLPGDTTMTRLVLSQTTGISDSLYTAHVFTRSQIVSFIHDTTAAGVPYVKGGYNIQSPATGNYDTHLVSMTGCDSTVSLALVVVPTSEVRHDTICQGDAYTLGDSTFTAAGTYTVPVRISTQLTDSVTLHLFVVDSAVTVRASICEGGVYFFEGNQYSRSGVYSIRKTGARGCDQVSTLYLTVKDKTPVDVYDTICSGDNYVGYGVTIPAVAVDTMVEINSTTAEQCDSVTHLHITVMPTYEQYDTTTLIQGQTMSWQGQTITAAGDYVANLTTTYGCDSILNLHVDVVSMVDNISILEMEIVPNPVNAGETSFIYGNFGDVKSVEILNSFGQIVDTFVPAGYPIEVQGLNASGVYYVRVTTADDRVAVQKLIVK